MEREKERDICVKYHMSSNHRLYVYIRILTLYFCLSKNNRI